MTTQQVRSVNKNNQPVQNHCIQCAGAEMMRMMFRDLIRDGYTINRNEYGDAVSISKDGRTLPII